MEINRSNFDTRLSQLFSAIRESDFISIDTNAEVTGFLGIDESFNSKHLSDKEWWNTIVAKQRKRSSLDFGVTAFRRKVTRNDNNTSQKKTVYEVKSFFVPMMFAYVEEHDDCYNDADVNGEELLEIDGFGMEFIQRTSLDLNLALYNGTPFMNAERRERAAWFMRKHPQFMKLDKSSTNGDLDVYYFPKVIENVTEEDISSILERLRGIAKFFDVVSETKVPVVGHNLLIKLILLYKDFVEYLPKEFSSFFEKLKAVLPQFYDTKYIAWSLKNLPGKETVVVSSESQKNLGSYVGSHCLFDLFRALKNPGSEVMSFDLDEESNKMYAEEMKDILESEEKLELDGSGISHTSGFDSFVAGMVFAKLAFLNVETEGKSPVEFQVNKSFFETRAVQWKNKFYVPEEIKEYVDPFLK